MKWKRVAIAATAGVLVMNSLSFGAGFAIIEQSVSGLGNAFAGGAASAEDATTVFFNPAGMTRLEGQQAIAGLHLIVPSTEFDKENASNALGQPISGGEGGDAGEAGLVPNFFYVANLENGWSLGLGVAAPFGLVTEYDKSWVGRYHAVKSEVMTININPSVAYQVNDRLSLGAGVSAQYIDVNLTSMVDFGLAAFLGSGNDPALAPLVSNPDSDIFADLEADDWGYGFNLGLLYEFDEDSRVGLAYRSRIDHTVEGDGDFSLQNPAFLSSVGLQDAAQAAFPDQGVEGDLTLPATVSLSGYHRISPQWAVMADVLWTEWSTFDELVIEFDGGLADSVTAENWDDSWRYSVGATYSPNEKLDLRLGLAYDETPIPSSRFRTPRIAGEDRFWTAVGVGYQISERMAFDFAYAHLFVKDSKIDKSTADAENLSRGNLQGEYENEVDIVSIQLAYSF